MADATRKTTMPFWDSQQIFPFLIFLQMVMYSGVCDSSKTKRNAKYMISYHVHLVRQILQPTNQQNAICSRETERKGGQLAYQPSMTRDLFPKIQALHTCYIRLRESRPGPKNDHFVKEASKLFDIAHPNLEHIIMSH